MELDVYNEQGEVAGKIDLDDDMFEGGIRYRLLSEVIKMYEARRRSGSRSTKTRAERSGGSRKPWRQKGTGRARHGSIRSPLWRNGGVVFGPRPKDYSYALPRKALKRALRSALCGKLLDGEVKVLEDMIFDEPKTARAAAVLKALGLDGKKALIVPADADTMLHKSCRNIPGVSVVPLGLLNAYEVLSGGHLVIAKKAAERIGEVVRA